MALWEVLTGKRLFQGDDPRQVIGRILAAEIVPPSKLARHLPAAIDAVVMRGLERDPLKRYATAREMAIKLEECIEPASPTQVGQWVDSMAHAALAKRAATLAAIENSSSRALEADANAASTSSRVLPGSGTSLTGFEGPESIEPSSEYSVPSRRSVRDMPTAAYATQRATAGRRSWIIGAAFLLTAAVAFLFLRRLGRPAADVVRGPEAREVATASASAAPPRPSVDAPPSAPSASAEPPAHATASAAPSAARSSGREAGEASTGTRTVKSVPAPVKRAVVTLDCDPPYSLDAQGHKIWKDECFRKQAP